MWAYIYTLVAVRGLNFSYFNMYLAICVAAGYQGLFYSSLNMVCLDFSLWILSLNEFYKLNYHFKMS